MLFFFDTPVALFEEGVLIPLPSPRPYHKGEGCSWRRYSSARVLVSQQSLCPKGLAEHFIINYSRKKNWGKIW